MDTKKFDLNIEKVLEDWEVYHAIREIISNALDEQLLTETSDIKIFKDGKGVWHIRDFGRGIKYEHLTQNENEEKLKKSHLVIGKFGVGLKDALATFDRHKVRVLIKSKYGDITIGKSSKHGFEDITTLHALINDPTEKKIIGTEFILGGCKKDDIDKAKSFFLKFSGEELLEKTEFGEVLKKSSNTAKIYINGLRVAEEENFLFSYNITSLTRVMRKALNRERTHVGRTAYTDRVKAILLLCRDKNVAMFLVDNLKEYETGLLSDELKWTDVAVHACKLLNANEKVIFLTPSELVYAKDMADRAVDDGFKIVTIPDNIKSKIRGLTDLKGNPIRDLEEYKSEWDESFEFKFVNEKNLSSKEREVFSRTKKILEIVGGAPRSVKKILISETMRLETMGYREAAGVWEEQNNRIVIKRDQLKNLELYAGTLLHEIAHAKSGASDVSKEFEQELSRLLGLAASKGLSIERR
ncbi:MAG: sensor histidine kinase [Candidatus Aenigmarchaeota archaeon]|nr:sensor histidine kinase [Candidatus Aenigmarchaeota archaeon]